MRTFVLSFIAIYTCMHALFYMRVRILLPSHWPFHAALITFLVLMIFAPIGTRLLEQGSFEIGARFMAYSGYLWMGFLFLSFLILLLTGLLDLACRVINAPAHAGIPSLSGRAPTAVFLVFALLVSVYGYFDAENIRVERVVIKTAKLPENTDRLKIAQISDVHIGLIVRSDRLRRIVNAVRKENPDILVSTGDLLDGNPGHQDGTSQLLRSIRPRLGKFAVTGNHEFYAGIEESIASTERFGFVPLRGQSTIAGSILNIVGVDDPAMGYLPDESKLLASARNGLFTVLLKHRPEPSDASLGLFDLQLSGHTHRGQIFPFNYITRMVYARQDGFYQLDKGSMLYTSRGTGTWGPPMRVLSPPEVTIIELVREDGKDSEVK